MGEGMAAGRYKAYIVHTGIVLGPVSACAPPPLPNCPKHNKLWRCGVIETCYAVTMC